MKKSRDGLSDTGAGGHQGSGPDLNISQGKKEKKNRGRRFSLSSIRGWMVWAVLGAGVLMAVGFMVLSIFHGLPDEETIKNYRPPVSSEVRDCHHDLIFSLGQDRVRLWVPLSSVSHALINAVVTSEDDTFFEHSGIRVGEIRKAFWKDLKKKRWIRGASTITQQLAKNAFLHKKKTIRRKLQEAIVARRIEKVLTKKRILELYLNVAEWGDGVYGVETAARTCFGKPASGLSIAESAMLAGMLPNPKYRNPFIRFPKVREKQVRVLDLMKHNGVISEDEYRTAVSDTLVLRQGPSSLMIGQTSDMSGDRCTIRMLREYLDRRFGKDALLRRHSVICLTVDLKIQKQLEQVFEPGNGDSILVVRQGQAVRAFQCIGGRGAVDPDFFVRMLEEKEALIGNGRSGISEFPDSTAQRIDPSAAAVHPPAGEWQAIIFSENEWNRLDLIDR